MKIGTSPSNDVSEGAVVKQIKCEYNCLSQTTKKYQQGSARQVGHIQKASLRKNSRGEMDRALGGDGLFATRRGSRGRRGCRLLVRLLLFS